MLLGDLPPLGDLEAPFHCEEDKLGVCDWGNGHLHQGENAYFSLENLDFVQTWWNEWFYLKDRIVLGQQYGIAPFELTARVTRQNTWWHILTVAELEVVEPLVPVAESLSKWVSGGQLIVVFLRRCIQLLQCRAHPMWQYTGLEDPTRCSAVDISGSDLLFRVQQVSSARTLILTVWCFLMPLKCLCLRYLCFSDRLVAC